MPGMIRRNPNTVEASRLPVALGAILWVRSYTGVNTSDLLVSSWTDLSGNGQHLTCEGAPETPPVLAAAILNGKPGVQFNGTSDRLETPDDLIWSVGKRFTMLILSQRTGPGSDPGGLVGAFGFGGTGQVIQDGTKYYFYTGIFDTELETHTETTPELKVIRRVADTTINFRRGRVDIGDVGFGNNWTEATDQPVSLGGYKNRTGYWGGYIFEVQGYSSSLSDADVIAIENDIYARWSL